MGSGGGYEYWKVDPWRNETDAEIRGGASAQVDLELAEKYRQNNVARGRATGDYQNAIMELQRARNSNQLQNTKAGSADRGRMNNMAANTGMARGAGAGTNLSQLMQKYADIRAGIDNSYQTDYGKQTYEYNRGMNDITEADRVLANSRANEINKLYQQLYGEAWDRYIQMQTLYVSAAEARNKARDMSNSYGLAKYAAG